jgi:hypothetical protein
MRKMSMCKGEGGSMNFGLWVLKCDITVYGDGA